MQIIETKFLVYRFMSPHLTDDERKHPQRVYWLSRHELLECQKQAIFHLHGKNVELWHIPDIMLSSGDELVRCINQRFSDGFVYAIAPLSFIFEAQNFGCNFGAFLMNRDPNGEKGYSLGCVFHYRDGKKNIPLGGSDLARFDERQTRISVS